MKKLFTLMLAALMLLTLAVPAFAAGETGSITINGVGTEATYEIYKMLDFMPSGEKSGIYTIVPGWEAFFAAAPATDYFKVTTNAGQTTVDIKDLIAPCKISPYDLEAFCIAKAEDQYPYGEKEDRNAEKQAFAYRTLINTQEVGGDQAGRTQGSITTRDRSRHNAKDGENAAQRAEPFFRNAGCYCGT